MQEVLTERAQYLMVKPWDRSARSDPDGLYHEAAEMIADLAEAWSAAREVIAGLRRKLDPAS